MSNKVNKLEKVKLKLKLIKMNILKMIKKVVCYSKNVIIRKALNHLVN